jgi:hypothetical protein
LGHPVEMPRWVDEIIGRAFLQIFFDFLFGRFSVQRELLVDLLQ